MLFECPYCSLAFPLSAIEDDLGALWCPRCQQPMRWADGELVARKADTGPFLRDIDKRAVLLVASGQEEAVAIEVRGELAKFAWDLGDYEDFDGSFFRACDFEKPGLYVWEGEVKIVDHCYPKDDHGWDFLDDLVAAGGWALKPVGPAKIRRPTLADGWECLRLEE